MPQRFAVEVEERNGSRAIVVLDDISLETVWLGSLVVSCESLPERSSRFREVLLALASLAVILPLGLYAKRGYHGPAAEWVRDSAGGVIYEILWCVAAVLVAPRAPASRIAGVVLVVTCCLEFLQLWHAPLLEAARANFFGRALLGSYFDWWDFPYYFVGAAIGFAWLRAIVRR